MTQNANCEKSKTCHFQYSVFTHGVMALVYISVQLETHHEQSLMHIHILRNVIAIIRLWKDFFWCLYESAFDAFDARARWTRISFRRRIARSFLKIYMIIQYWIFENFTDFFIFDFQVAGGERVSCGRAAVGARLVQPAPGGRRNGRQPSAEPALARREHARCRELVLHTGRYLLIFRKNYIWSHQVRLGLPNPYGSIWKLMYWM